MPILELRLAALWHWRADETLLAEALLFPGVACFHERSSRAGQMLARRVQAILKELPPGEVYRHRLAEPPATGSIAVEVPAPRESLCRREPVSLTFHYVTWPHGNDAFIAYVPALGIEVLAEDERQLAEQLVPQIRLALARRESAASLRDLALLGQFTRLEVETLPLRVKLPTLKQAAEAHLNDDQGEKPILEQVGVDLARGAAPPIYEREADLARLAQRLTGRSPQSVLLVGKSGVGKTALVQELARLRAQHGLPRTPFWSTSGSQIIAGMSGFGMWQQRCQKLIDEASKAQAIVHLGNLIELIEVGKGGGNTQGVAALLRPAIARAAPLAIAECTPEQLAIVEREDPQLLEAFVQLDLAEPTPEQTRTILQRAAGDWGLRGSTRISADALATLDRLHRRYATYSAAPSRPLRFLRNLLEDQPPEAAIESPAVTAAFSRETGLPLFMLDDALPLDLEATRAWFAQRVIGQPAAVDLVVDLMALVKAGLARGGKPIGSLLFIGPTGVGKTEMAKALAEFLYQDAGRMVRFDMSEYAHPAAVERLIGGAYSAQGLLTQKVRSQPFMVVLLDEFEKAHPLLFDVLLQVLGEGRLTDGAGRVADFTNSLIIMTSNLGAESFRRRAAGFAGESFAAAGAQAHFERAVKAFLRPEMFNRLDRIVPFMPLERETIAAIARREVERVANRDGLRLRGGDLQIDPAALARLAEGGFDVRYGARPLKRNIDRRLVAPLAARLTAHAGAAALACRVELAEGEIVVASQPAPARRRASADAQRDLPTLLDRLIELRRKTQRLEQSGAVLQLRNEIFRFQQAQRRQKKKQKRNRPERYRFTAQHAQLLAREELLKRIDRLIVRTAALEDQTLLGFYRENSVDAAAASAACHELEGELNELLFALYQAGDDAKRMLTLAIFGASLPRVLELSAAYEAICAQHRGEVLRYWLKMYRPDLDVPLTALARTAIPNHGAAPGQSALMPVMHLKSRKKTASDVPHKVVDVYRPQPQEFGSPPEDCIGVALQIVAGRPVVLLGGEGGKHEFIAAGHTELCVVEAVGVSLLNYDPPAEAGRRGALADTTLRRTYDFQHEACRDPLVAQQWPLRVRSIDGIVATAVEANLARQTWALLEAWN